MTENAEFLKTITIDSFLFPSATDALTQYRALPESVKRGMARCYKAFEEEPWFDPPYDSETLMNSDFPTMVESFVPGALVIAKNMNGDVIGFASGGQTTVVDLVKKKYKDELPENQQQIVMSIMQQTGMNETDVFMYENELVLASKKTLPLGQDDVRNKGLGTMLSKARQDVFEEISYGAILGRSLNPYLLKMKQKLLSEQNGFMMTRFIPDGDTYTNPVTQTKRSIYFAAKTR